MVHHHTAHCTAYCTEHWMVNCTAYCTVHCMAHCIVRLVTEFPPPPLLLQVVRRISSAEISDPPLGGAPSYRPATTILLPLGAADAGAFATNASSAAVPSGVTGAESLPEEIQSAARSITIIECPPGGTDSCGSNGGGAVRGDGGRSGACSGWAVGGADSSASDDSGDRDEDEGGGGGPFTLLSRDAAPPLNSVSLGGGAGGGGSGSGGGGGGGGDGGGNPWGGGGGGGGGGTRSASTGWLKKGVSLLSPRPRVSNAGRKNGPL